MGFAAVLRDGTDVDGAEYQLGRSLDLFEGQTFLDVKWIFWTDNPLGNALHDMLMALVKAGVLAYRDVPDQQVRWVATAAPDLGEPQ